MGGSVGSLLELGAGFHPDFTGRENIFLSGSIYGLKRREIDERLDEIVAFSELERFIDFPVRTYSSGMLMRLGFSIAVHVEADMLLLDEVFAVGDEAFQRKCVDKILEFTRQGGTLCFVSHAASAVERLCERAVLLGQGRGRVRRRRRRGAEPLPQRCLRSRRCPRRSASGFANGGPARCGSSGVASTGADGVARDRFVSGEPVVDPDCCSSASGRAAAGLSLELRDMGGALLGASQPDLGELGWDGAPGERELRFAVEHLPLAEGSSSSSVTLTTRRDRGATTGSTRRRSSSVEPSDGARGAAALRGRVVAGRTRDEGRGRMSSRTCPDWPELTEIAPDLQFKHYTVAEARLPADALVQLGDFPLGGGGDLRRSRQERLLRSAHGSAGGRGAPRHALVRGARVGDERSRAARA